MDDLPSSREPGQVAFTDGADGRDHWNRHAETTLDRSRFQTIGGPESGTLGAHSPSSGSPPAAAPQGGAGAG